MSVKITINKSGLRKLERKMAANIKKSVQNKLPPGTEVADGDAEAIAKDVTKAIEKAFK